MNFHDQLSEIISEEDKVEKLTHDEVLELSRKLNPYGHAPTPVTEDSKKFAICSYTNCTAEYMRKFTMTSMIAFIYQMLKEWEVPASVRRWIPKNAHKQAANEDIKPADLDTLIERLETLLTIAKATREEKKDKPNELLGASLGLSMFAHMLSEDIKRKIPKTLDVANMTPEVKEEFDKFPEAVKERYRTLSVTVEIPAAVAKNIIQTFVDTYLQYDPLVHARPAVPESQPEPILPPSEQEKQEKQKKQEKVTVDGYTLAKFKEARANAMIRGDELGQDYVKTMFASPVNYNAASAVLNNESLLDAVVYFASEQELYERIKPFLHENVTKVLDITPPQDTLHRWSYFTEVNYEDIRKAAEALYCDRPTLEWTIALWDTVEGSQEECDKKFEAYKTRYQDELPMDIKMLQFGGWTPLADFQANRAKIDFYNKNTGVIKKILDRHLEDQKIGQDMVKNRVRVKKAQNIKEAGPDHPTLKDYQDVAATNMKALGAVKGLTKEQQKRLEAAKGDLKAAKDLEYIDNVKARLKEYEDILQTREHDITEARDYEFYKKQYVDALEMLEVPDDSIRVDMHVVDGDKMETVTLYTKSGEALDREQVEMLEKEGETIPDEFNKVARFNYGPLRTGNIPVPDRDAPSIQSAEHVIESRGAVPKSLLSAEQKERNYFAGLTDEQRQLIEEANAAERAAAASGPVIGEKPLAPFATAIYENVKDPKNYKETKVVSTIVPGKKAEYNVIKPDDDEEKSN